MEAKINIAEILKDKPQGTKLYSPAFGECTLYLPDCLSVSDRDNEKHSFMGSGKIQRFGEIMLYPSKEMRDWTKFAWKKGDVLICKDNTHIIFEKFEDNTYTRFKGKHYLFKLYTKEDYCKETPQMTTSSFEKANDYEAQSYIKTIEKKLGGKFNRETLEVEKPHPEFKDGDILSIQEDEEYYHTILIFKGGADVYVYFDCFHRVLTYGTKVDENEKSIYHLATEEEKQQLFAALAKEGKAWDAERKVIVDLRPKCEFKPFDRCIWKIRNCEGSIWQASFVSYVDEYGAIPMGMSIDEDLVNLIILPYNEETAKLIGTTDDWKGGKQ